MTAPAYHEDPGPEQPFMSHLVELRDRLLRMVMAVALTLLVLFPFANDIYTFIAEPIRAQLPEGSTLIATHVTSPFMTPFKLALVAAVFVSMPYLLYQIWGFVAPGLYQHEKRFALPLLTASIILFYVGMAFAYYLVFPLVFAFFAATTPEGVAQMPDITFYLDFVLTIFFAFGVAFQIPIATILLVMTGITPVESLVDKRPYVIVGCFVVGMLLTPPDVISQTLLAVPMWLLYEAGIFFSRFFARSDQEEEAGGPAPDPGGGGPGGRAAGGKAAAGVAAGATVGAGVAAGNGQNPVAAGAGASVMTTNTPGASPPLSPEASPAGSGDSPRPEAAGTVGQAAEVLIGREIDGGDPFDRERFVPMTPEEMEAELDAIEAAEAEAEAALLGEEPEAGQGPGAGEGDARDPIDALLERVGELRDLENEAGARQLLYRVLADGNESQRVVAMNILTELDTP